MFRTLESLELSTLAGMLEVSEPELLHLCKNSQKMYSEYPLIKNNKARIIEEPSQVLKRKQRVLTKKILYGLRVHPRLYGCPGTSIKDAVADHIRKPVVITLDIKDFFPSVKCHLIRSTLRRRMANDEVTDALVRLTTYKNHLPHGSPSSPCLARLVLNPLALNLERLLRSINPDAIFSIYVDDITISGPKGITRAIQAIRGLIERHGFVVNPQKIKVMKRNQDQESLSVRLNKRIEPTRSYLRKLEAIRDQYPHSHSRIRGMQAFVDFLFRA